MKVKAKIVKRAKAEGLRLKAVKAFTISRRRWLRGEGASASRLVRGSDGKECCIGMYLRACGVPRKRLVGWNVPHELVLLQEGSTSKMSWPKSLAWLFEEHDIAVTDLTEVNDAVHVVVETDREKNVTELFAKRGVKVEFGK